MKPQRPYPSAQITAKGARSVRRGHPWIYEAEVLSLSSPARDGDLVDALSPGGSYLGTGFFNSRSKIRIRLLSQNANDAFDEAFWKRRLSYAWEYRKTVMGADRACCRIVFGEADQLPGLTVDRFGPLLSVQILCLGIERRRDVILPALFELLRADGEDVRGIYLRNDAAIRTLEGMEEEKGWYALPGVPIPESPVTQIVENGLRYQVDVENGQKTGFFLDQKYNRQAVARLAKGKRVLDCFTHTGSFALNAAQAGASHVLAADISQTALDLARQNACANGLEEKIEFRRGDVFELLPQLSAAHEKFDFIILDPPAFTKSRKTAAHARKGYLEINRQAMRLLPRGGYLATCSCSHFMPRRDFESMLRDAADEAGVQLKQIEARQQAPDHPILWNVPETDYLKFYLFQIL